MVSVENTKYVGAKTSEQGLHKRKDISNGYEEIDQFDKGKISSGPHQLPVNLAGSQTPTKSPEDKMHPYDVVTQPTGGNAVPNDQQHIYDRTQHPSIRDKTQQTRDEYNQDKTTGRGQYEHLDNTRQGSRKKEARSEGHDYYDSVSITEQEKHHGTGTPSSQENLYHVLEGPTEENSSATTATEDMYSTPNFSSKGPPQSPDTQDNFYHVLEGPTPSPGSSPERSTAPGWGEENEYNEPVQPNWDSSSKSGQQLTQDSNNVQEDDYDQPAAITIKNKGLNSNEGGSNEGGDQPVLFDDPTYQVASALV